VEPWLVIVIVIIVIVIASRIGWILDFLRRRR